MQRSLFFVKCPCGIFCNAYLLQLSQFSQMHFFYNSLIRIKGILFIPLVVLLLSLFIIINIINIK